MEANFDDAFKTRPYPAHAGQENAVAPGPTQAYADPAGISVVAGIRELRGKKSVSSLSFSAGDRIELNSIGYEVCDVISGAGKSAEAAIYRIRNSEGNTFALKLYYEFTDSSLEPSADTLQRIREISGGEILNLYDFGTGPNKYLNRYCFEVSEFARGGDLVSVEHFRKKFTPGFIEDVVVSGIFRGIERLHSQRIYHCDLKPQNVFFLDAEQTRVVIGDYGSAKSFDKSNAKELNYTTLTKGTEFYLAPEQAFGIVSQKNDYYSLGMIVLHLLYPEFVSHQNLRRIFERRTRGIQIVDFDGKFPRLNRLIEGLTLQDYNSRWGRREVDRWLDGLDVPISYKSGERSTRLRIGRHDFGSGKDLARYIATGNAFYDELIEDRDGYGMLLTWIDDLEGEESRKIFDAMIAYYKKYFGIAYVKQALQSYFIPPAKIQIGAKIYDFSGTAKLKEHINAFFEQIDHIWKFTDTATLRYYFFQFELAVRRLRVKSSGMDAALIDEVFEKLFQAVSLDYRPDFTDLKARLYLSLEQRQVLDMLYLMREDRTFRDEENRQYKSLSQVNDFLSGRDDWARSNVLVLERDAFVKRLHREELLGFISHNPRWDRLFLSGETGPDLLTDVLATILKSRYSRTFVSDFCSRMAALDPGYFQIALLRLIDPKRPFHVGGQQIALFAVADFNNKVRETFGLMDRHFLLRPVKEIRSLFFEFEFTVLQLGAADPINQKILVDPLMKKMEQVLGPFGGDSASLQPFWYRHLTKKQLIGLFYLFNPLRNFPGQQGQVIRNIRELALYFARNPEAFHDELAACEREAFLENRNYRSFLGMQCNDFLMKVFRQQAKLFAETEDIHFGEPEYGEVTIVYHYRLSLDHFFATQGISLNITESSNTPASVVIKGTPFTPLPDLFQRYGQLVVKRHQPGAGMLAGDSRENFFRVHTQQMKARRFAGLKHLPRYLAFGLPVFVVLYFVVKYLSGGMLISVFGHDFSHETGLAGARLPRGSFPVLFTSAYFLNLVAGILILAAFAVLFRNRALFDRFLDFHSTLIRRLTLFMTFAPVIAIVVYLLLTGILGRQPFLALNGYDVSATTIIIILDGGLLIQQMVALVVALFRIYRRFYVLPFVLAVVLFMIFGYFSLIRPEFMSRNQLHVPVMSEDHMQVSAAPPIHFACLKAKSV